MILAIKVFHRGPYGPPSTSDWTQGIQLILGVQLLLEGSVHVNTSKKTYQLVIFKGDGVWTPFLPSGPSHQYDVHFSVHQ